MKKIIVSLLSILIIGALAYAGQQEKKNVDGGEGCGCGLSSNENQHKNEAVNQENKIEKQRLVALNHKHFNLEKGNVTLEGYDVVSYYSAKGPVKGSKEYAFTHEGITYYFKDEKSKKVFRSNPKKYVPAYGGWCAYAMAENKGKKVSVNIETYKIINGKLHLFYNAFLNNTLKKWKNGDEESFLKKANAHWAKIINPEKPQKAADK